MRKFLYYLLILLISISTASCIPLDTGALIKITAPSNKNIPLYGQWEVYDYKTGSSSGMTGEEAASWMGKKAAFLENAAMLGDEYCTKPSYKIKYVNSVDYLLYQYKISPDYLELKDENIKVITLTSDNQFFHEFISISDSKIIVNIDGVFLYLKKISDNVDDEFIERYLDSSLPENLVYGSEPKVNSGLLIGLKSDNRDRSKSSYEGYDYRTLWISSVDKHVKAIYGTGNLFVPRKSGFWTVGVTREKYDGIVKDSLFANPAGKIENEALNVIYTWRDDALRNILYAGTDYISTEVIPVQEDNKNRRLEVLPIDNIEGASPIKISDIAGENGRTALYDGISKLIDDSAAQGAGSTLRPDEESFYIARRNGHWIMKGRVNTKSQPAPYMDFNIRIIPPSRLVSYDELCLSWNSIKAKVPDAQDAYTSPNADIAVVLTGSTLYVYTIENGSLSQNPSKMIKLKDKETVVMAEWCSGKYVDIWDKEFMKNPTYMEDTLEK